MYNVIMYYGASIICVCVCTLSSKGLLLCSVIAIHKANNLLEMTDKCGLCTFTQFFFNG